MILCKNFQPFLSRENFIQYLDLARTKLPFSSLELPLLTDRSGVIDDEESVGDRCLEEKVGRKQDLGPRTVVTNSLETASSLFHSRRDGRAAQSGKHKGFVFLWGLPFYGVVSTCKYPRGFSLAQCQPQDETKDRRIQRGGLALSPADWATPELRH